MIENIKVLLLGGTGAIGENLGEVLNKKGYMVYVTSRKYRKNAENVHYIQGNAKDTAFLKKLLNEYKVDIIFDFMLIPLNSFKVDMNFYYHRVNNISLYHHKGYMPMYIIQKKN